MSEKFATCPDCNVGTLSIVAGGEHFCDQCGIDEARAKQSFVTNLYASLLPRLRYAAFNLGYALALHGTMVRDLDLIAVPWIETAASAHELAAAILKASGGYILGERENRDPAPKPHGRLCWSIHVGGHSYIDLSVMPRAESEGIHA